MSERIFPGSQDVAAILSRQTKRAMQSPDRNEQETTKRARRSVISVNCRYEDGAGPKADYMPCALLSHSSTSMPRFEGVQHWKEQEVKFMPSSNVWHLQDEVTPSMRQILIDWLFEVCDELKLIRETFFLAVNYVDRFLGQIKVKRAQLQLVGVACLWLAAKYEEVSPPLAKDLVGMTNDTYSVDQLCSMESKVLSCLGFEMGPPTAVQFLQCYRHMAGIKSLWVHLHALHLAELSTLATVPAPRASHTCSPATIPADFAAPLRQHAAGTQTYPRVQSRYNAVAATASDDDDDINCPAVTSKPPVGSSSQSYPAKSIDLATPLVNPCAAASSLPSPPAEASTSSACSGGTCISSRPCTPELSHEAGSAQSLAPPTTLLLSALPSHVAAASLYLSMATHQKLSPTLLSTFADMAEAEPQYLLMLSEELQQLHSMLSLVPSPCAMVKCYRTQKMALQQRALQHLQLQGLQQQQQLGQHQLGQQQLPLQTLVQAARAQQALATKCV